MQAYIAAALFDIECTAHNNSQQSSTSKECIWKRKAKPNEKSCPLEELKIAKAECEKILNNLSNQQPLIQHHLNLIMSHLWIH